jgi:hypothetical protein
MIKSERDARGPEDHDAPLEWRAPSKRKGRHLAMTAFDFQASDD